MADDKPCIAELYESGGLDVSERGLDDLCDEKQAEADLISESADRSDKPERKEAGR